jgi:hypothetical protein
MHANGLKEILLFEELVRSVHYLPCLFYPTAMTVRQAGTPPHGPT